MRARRVTTAVAILTTALLVATGCSNGDRPSAGSNPPAVDTAAAGNTTPADSAPSGDAGSAAGSGAVAGSDSGAKPTGKVKKIALMVQDLSNPFFSAMQKGVEADTKKLGAEVNTLDGRQDLGTQNDQIDNLIQQKYDILLLNAVDSAGIGSAVARAKAAGITVAAVDVTSKGAPVTVTTDNVAAGKEACQYLVDAIGKNGNILIVDGTPISSVQDRVKGCQEVLSATPDVKVVGQQNGDNGRAKGLELTTTMLTAHPDVVGIFGINDPTALGATLAAQAAGKNDITIVGVDGSPDAVAELKKGNSLFKATSAQDPAGLASKALEMAIQMRGGQEPKEPTILEPTKLITADNVSSYKGW